MIQSFGDEDTKRVINSESPRRFPPGIIRPAYRKLIALANVMDLADMAVPPSNRLEKLKGRHKNYWNIRITQQWRILFQWNAGVADGVTIIDYHCGKDKL